MQISFDGQKHIFWQAEGCGPYLAGINIRDALLQNIMIMAIYCMFNFYSHTR